MELSNLRWQALGMIGVSFQYIKNYLKNRYMIDIKEANIEEFTKNLLDYTEIDNQKVLFELEDMSFKKIMVYSLREKELEEVINTVFREQFVNSNRMEGVIGNKKLNHIDTPLSPCYVSFGANYIIVKMAQLRCYMGDDVDEDNVVISSPKEYFHCAKFVIDIVKGLVFLFYNDINNDEEEGNWKAKAVTEKKQAFYNLFNEGTQYSLLKFGFENELYLYIKRYLDALKLSGGEGDGPVLVIETSDPSEGKNSLRSSKVDGKHSRQRLDAIRYALEYERHTVRSIECTINSRWFHIKNYGEIITSGPYLSKEVIESVCEEVFPDYRISERAIAEGDPVQNFGNVLPS
ncbi:hypothetical protein [Clostridium sp.]|jgi:hypothetical protein|uniref:hypothetical protein n=1 Tax=Clostridium sp. TaxID=1506 RepID=UPI003EEB0A7B